MAKKEFTYKGKTLEELKKMTPAEFMKFVPSRIRRTLKKGFTEQQKKVLQNMKANASKVVKTHCRDMVILPEMVGRLIKIHNGKEFLQIEIQPEMLGHVLGEFAITTRKVSHSAPGIGATKSSASMSLK